MTRFNVSPISQNNAEKSDRRRWGRAQIYDTGDPYKRPGKWPEPAVCPTCQAVYRNGRWQWAERPAGAVELLCQACQRIADNFPAGILTLSGPFVQTHGDELLRLARHQEEAEKGEHALNRIMAITTEAADRVVISTTDIHTPRRIGEAILSAYRGALAEHFDEDGYFVRIEWRRDT